MRAYRVIIEAIDEDGVVDQRVEVREAFDEQTDDWSAALGIATAGAIDGICVFDEPYSQAVAGTMLWRMNVSSDLFNAIGSLYRRWRDQAGEGRDLDDVAVVACLKTFDAAPLWGVAVDELPQEPTRDDSGAGDVSNSPECDRGAAHSVDTV